MKTDRTTKALLFAIALGLWLHLIGERLKPTPVLAQSVSREIFGDPQLNKIVMHLEHISLDTASMKASLQSIADTAIRRR